MRVTERTKHDTVVGNMQTNAQRLQRLQREISSGLKINKTSDDPVGATVMQDVITTISSKEQLQANLKDNLAWLIHFPAIALTIEPISSPEVLASLLDFLTK